jgi:uncharacterized sulfatase
MHRRKFLSAAAAAAMVAGTGPLGRRIKAAERRDGGESPGARPNILFILVDELRFPRVFPAGISDAGEFLAKFMPSTHELWLSGVKFANHHTAGIACSPARGVIVTGLYTQQSWMVQTILDKPTTTVSIQPVLNPAYPTYGKLLRQAGYQTPLIGKWHLSIPHSDPDRLEAYGFEGLTVPDPTGSNLQGTVGDEANGYLNDQDIEDQATAWLRERVPEEDPWCLTVDFVNPHDKEFFPAGTEFQTFTNLFAGQQGANPLQQFIDYSVGPPDVSWDANPLKDPDSYGYPALPPNWESADQLAANKPSTQTFTRLFQEAVWGGVADDPNQTTFTIDPYPTPPGVYGVGKAPHSYWQRSLDSYTQIMSILDAHIGAVVAAMPPGVAENTVIVFTSDHGDYASAHGFVSGKAGSCYDEVWNVPLIVVDPSHRLTADTDIVRNQLTSSVDIMPLLVSLGHNGSRDWITGDLVDLYGQRHDMIPMLQSAQAPGRPYVLYATDEVVPDLYNFNGSPGHIIGMRTEEAKLGVYANWVPGTTDLAMDGTLETEFYDYGTPDGRAEVNSTPDDPRAQKMLTLLLDEIIPGELRAPLPQDLRAPQAVAREEYLAYRALVNQQLTLSDFLGGAFRTVLGLDADGI